METYISSKWEIYLKKGFFIAFFFWWLFIIPFVKDIIRTGDLSILLPISLIVAQSISLIYVAKLPTIVLIENHEIIIKAVSKEERFDIREFRMVTKRWGSSAYQIHFMNGQKFWFWPKLTGNPFYDLASKVDVLNVQINEIKERCTNAPQ